MIALYTFSPGDQVNFRRKYKGPDGIKNFLLICKKF